jgi:hypothetical protein
MELQVLLKETMIKKRNIIYFIYLLLVFQSCGKTSVDCFSDPGPVENVIRVPDSSFSGIKMYDNIDVELVASNFAQIELIGGNKLLDAITTEVENNNLILRNTSECSFLRSSDRPIKAIIYYTNLDSIIYRSNGNLTALGAIKSDTFKIDIFEGSGNIRLILKTSKSYLNYHFGTADLYVEGNSNVNYIYQVSYGPIDARELRTEYTYLESRSPNNCYVQSNISLEATINGPGNVYYSGNVSDPILTGSGSGKLLRLP